MKKITALILSAAMLLCLLAGCTTAQPVQGVQPSESEAVSEPTAAPESEPSTEASQPAAEAAPVSFTDSCGRTVELPADIVRVAPSGAVATMILSAIAPEYMVCASSNPSETQMKYLPAELSTISATGQLYGSKANLDLEALLATDPQVIIDLGDMKGDMAADLDALQEQTGVPVIFIEADLDSMAEAYRTLGTLLSDKADRGEELAAFVDETLTMAAENSAKISDADKLSVMYTSGDAGLDTNADGSTQAQVLGLVGADNAVVVEDVSNKGGGNTVSLEQMYLFDPDVVIFTTESIYDTVAVDEAWQSLSAISDGKYCEIPGLPYNWMSNPPSVNMLLGVWWLGNLLYPEVYDYDMTAKAQEIYKLFWNYDLSDNEAAEMLSRASFK